MTIKLNAFLLVLITGTSSLDIAVPLPSQENYVVQLSLNLRNESRHKFIIDLIDEDMENYNIQVADVLKLYRLDVVTYTEAASLLNEFNSTASTIDWLETGLKFGNTSFDTFYNTWIKDLGLSGDALQRTITALGLDLGQFSYTLTYNISNIYNLLRNGSYGEDNVNGALTTIGKTRDQVFDSARNILLGTLTRLAPTDFLSRLKDFNFDKNSAIELWSKLNITNEHVSTIEHLNAILLEIVNSVNTSIAVFVAEDSIIFHQLVYQNLINLNYNYLQILAGKNSIELDRYHQHISQDAVEFKLKSKVHSFAEITTSFVKQCTYVTIVNSTIVHENVELVEDEASPLASINKTNTTIFYLGSPLICNHKLYAIASSDNGTTIQFSTFLPNDDEESGSFGYLGPNLLLYFVLAAPVLLL